MFPSHDQIVPANSLIEQTMPRTLASEFKNAVNFWSGGPRVNYYSRELLEHIQSQLDVLKGANYHSVGNIVSKGLSLYKDVLDKDSIAKKNVTKAFNDFIAYDKEGYPRPKYDPLGQLIDYSKGEKRDENVGAIKSEGASNKTRAGYEAAIKAATSVEEIQKIKEEYGAK